MESPQVSVVYSDCVGFGVQRAPQFRFGMDLDQDVQIERMGGRREMAHVVERRGDKQNGVGAHDPALDYLILTDLRSPFSRPAA